MYSIIDTIRYVYYISIYWILRGAWNIHLYKSPKIDSKLDVEKVFYDSKKEQFLKYLAKVLDNCILNENIVSMFYDKQNFKEYMQQSNNDLEKTWKTRMLYVSTPRGNIAMYYDAFKLGFSYYSDQNVISYDILNACAMNYVRFYHCLDFFIDETVVPTRESPLIKLHYLDDAEEKKKNITKQRELDSKNNTIMGKIQSIQKGFKLEASPFAHFRNYIKKESSPITENKDTVRTLLQLVYDFFMAIITKKTEELLAIETQLEKEKEQEKMKNKFIYLGKMHNCQFSQKIPKKRRMLTKFTSPMLDTIVKDAGVQLERMKYCDFKKIKSMIPIDDSVN